MSSEQAAEAPKPAGEEKQLPLRPAKEGKVKEGKPKDGKAKAKGGKNAGLEVCPEATSHLTDITRGCVTTMC